MTLNPADLESAFRRCLARLETAAAPPTSTRHPEVQAARDHLRRSGWTQAGAARRLGVSTVHLCYVLTDRRISKRLLNAVRHLPPNPDPA